MDKYDKSNLIMISNQSRYLEIALNINSMYGNVTHGKTEMQRHLQRLNITGRIIVRLQLRCLDQRPQIINHSEENKQI